VESKKTEQVLRRSDAKVNEEQKTKGGSSSLWKKKNQIGRRVGSQLIRWHGGQERRGFVTQALEGAKNYCGFGPATTLMAFFPNIPELKVGKSIIVCAEVGMAKLKKQNEEVNKSVPKTKDPILDNHNRENRRPLEYSFKWERKKSPCWQCLCIQAYGTWRDRQNYLTARILKVVDKKAGKVMELTHLKNRQTLQEGNPRVCGR